MRITSIIVSALLLTLCYTAPLFAGEWLLPDGRTVTTMDTSTPPMSGAQRVQYPVAIPSAPSAAQMQNQLPTSDPQGKPLSATFQSTPEPIPTSPYFQNAKEGQWGDECAVFAQKARPELTGFGNANQMPDTARMRGFEVDGSPQAGSVLVIEKPAGSTYGHAEVVTNVQRVGERYVLNIVDSNANTDKLVSARTVYYTPSKDGVFGNYGTYEEATPEKTRLANELVVMGFIKGKATNSTVKEVVQ